MPENQNIEWKSKWKDEYLEWICGYANAQGGNYCRSQLVGTERKRIFGIGCSVLSDWDFLQGNLLLS